MTKATTAPIGADPYPRLARVMQGNAAELNEATRAIVGLLCDAGGELALSPPLLTMASLCAASYLSVSLVAADHRERRANDAGAIVKSEARRCAQHLAQQGDREQQPLVDLDWPLITGEDLLALLGNQASPVGDIAGRVGHAAHALSTAWARVFRHHGIDATEAVMAIICTAGACAVLWTDADKREPAIADYTELFRHYASSYAALLQSREQGLGTETRQ